MSRKRFGVVSILAFSVSAAAFADGDSPSQRGPHGRPITPVAIDDGMEDPAMPPPILSQVQFGCPTLVGFHVTNATPGGQVTLVYSWNLGAVVIPSGPCAGTVLGLGPINIQAISTMTATSSGFVRFFGNAGPTACNKYLQAVDITTCTTSNVVQIL